MTVEENIKLLREENEKLRSALEQAKMQKSSDALGGLGDMMKNLTPQIENMKKNAEILLKGDLFNHSKEIAKKDGIHGGIVRMMSDDTIIISCTSKSLEKYFQGLTKKK